jgi:predicted double-glycine peptidase
MTFEKILNLQKKIRIYRVTDIEKIKIAKEQYKLPLEVRVKKIARRKGFKIFLVNGCKIRQFIDFDFTMGGHGLRYIYVPLNEIWIDDSNKEEAEEIILHEITEFNLMKKGMSYDLAHEQASLKEIELRNKKIILPVGHHRQITPWSCGPSALKIILDYYKDKRDIKKLIKETGANIEGTLHIGFKKALKKMGYSFFEKKNSNIGQIEEFIQKGIPVIVDYKAHHGGHFSVIMGYNEKKFLLSDPASDRKYIWLNKKDFEKRWYEEDKPGKIVKKWLLAVYR